MVNSKPKRRRFTNPEDAFIARTERRGQCLIWQGSSNGVGYGEMRVGGKKVYAHRYAWSRVHGTIPQGMQVDHLCRNPSCVEVSHLRLASHAENLRNLAGPDAHNKTSGARNVYKSGKRWAVRIRKNGAYLNFGTYDTIPEADEVAHQKRLELFGEFAGLG